MTTHEPSVEAITECADAVIAAHAAAENREANPLELARAVLRCAVEKGGYRQGYDRDLLAVAKYWSDDPFDLDEKEYAEDIFHQLRRLSELSKEGCKVKYDEVNSYRESAKNTIREWNRQIKQGGVNWMPTAASFMFRLCNAWNRLAILVQGNEYAAQCFEDEKAEHAKTKERAEKAERELGELRIRLAHIDGDDHA